jgi:hypothetical protein
MASVLVGDRISNRLVVIADRLLRMIVSSCGKCPEHLSASPN